MTQQHRLFFSNIVFINLCTSFVAIAVTGHNKVMNLSSRVIVAKFGFTSSSLLNRQLLSAANTGHCTRKWCSLSRAGSGGGGPGALCEGGLVCGGSPGQQN